MIHKNSYGWMLFFLAFFAVGAGMTVWGGIVLRNASISVEWPTAQGEITSSHVDVSTGEDGTTYSADVEFKYVAGDRWLTADVVTFGEYGSSDPNYADGIVDKYPVGKMVSVYYNPEWPETAVLEPGIIWSSYFILLMGIIFLVMPAIIFGVMLRTGSFK